MLSTNQLLQLAELAALQSPDPYVKVGVAAVSNIENRIFQGWNHVRASVRDSFWMDRDARRPLVIHAEQHLCSQIRENECTILHTTLFPCAACMCLLVAHGFREVHYIDMLDKDKKVLEVAAFYNLIIRKHVRA